MGKKNKNKDDDKVITDDGLKYLAIGGVIVMVMFILMWLGTSHLREQPEPGQYDDFANCIAESGAKMYGAYWCSHCADQKQSFQDSWTILKDTVYIECDPKGENPQSELCLEEGIRGYPTWKFSNGKELGGFLTLPKIAEETGCKLQ